ncbi:Histidine kinase-, DNA gyrase B-, and HSP90-like ATPase [bacterium A37T11]|nr:Histidine kinase-, DNA gyrase B-, and HSP90-like ATPase [bacterium A37T11]
MKLCKNSLKEGINYTPDFRTLDVIVTPVILADIHNRHFYHNLSYQEEIGYSLEEVPDLDMWAIKAYPDEAYREEVIRLWNEKLKIAQRDGLSYINQVAKVRCKNQTYRWYDIYEHTLGEVRVITFLDVDQLQVKSTDLLDLLHFKRTVLSSLAHDIRGPLSALQNILKYGEKLNLSQKKWQSICLKMDEQINTAFSMIDATVIHEVGEMDRFQFTPQQIELLAFLEVKVGCFANAVREKSLSVQINVDADTVLIYDTFILEIMIRNLLHNAVKYSPTGGKIIISATKTDTTMQVMVRDEGEGLTKDQVDTLMSNESARKLRNEIRLGFGLGLLIAKESLERYQGKLLVESSPDTGSCFTICLPVLKNEM